MGDYLTKISFQTLVNVQDHTVFSNNICFVNRKFVMYSSPKALVKIRSRFRVMSDQSS